MSRISVTALSPQVPQSGVRHTFWLRSRHRRLPGPPAAQLPAPARAAPRELRARHQPHSGGRGRARARAADAARGLLPQRERRRPASSARRLPEPDPERRAQRGHDAGPAAARARVRCLGFPGCTWGPMPTSRHEFPWRTRARLNERTLVKHSVVLTSLRTPRVLPARSLAPAAGPCTRLARSL